MRPHVLLVLLAVLPAAALAQPVVRLTEGPNNNPAQFVGRSAVDYPMIQVALENQSGQTLDLRRVVFTASGTASEATDINANGVVLVDDVNNNGEIDGGEPILGTGNFTADDGTITFLVAAGVLPIMPGATRNVVLLYRMDQRGTATPGETFAVAIAQEADIEVRAQGTGDLAQYQGGAFPVLNIPKTVGNGTLFVTVLPDTVSSSILPYFLAGSTRSEGFRLRLENSRDERIAIASIVVTAGGTANEPAVIAPNGVRYVALPAPDTELTDALPVLATASISGNDGTATLSFAPPLQFARGEVKFASVAVATLFNLGQYFNDMRFSVEGGAFGVNGLDSLVSPLPVLGEGAAGSLRLYQGHANRLALYGPADRPATRGSQNLPVFSFTLTNDPFEPVTIASITISALGSANASSDITRVRLWRDVDGDATVSVGDVEIGTPQTFPAGPNPTVTFNAGALPLSQGAQVALLLAADLNAAVALGATLQFGVNDALAIDGTAPGPNSRIVTSNAPFVGPTRTVQLNEFFLDEFFGGGDAMERQQLPRTGSNIVLWNFGTDISLAENLTFGSLTVQVSGSVDDSIYLETVQLWYDRDGGGGPTMDDMDVLLGAVTVTANDPLMTFSGGALTLNAGERHNFYLVATLRNPPTSVYGQTVQFTIAQATSFALNGVLSAMPATLANAPFVSAEKPIVQPTATLARGAFPPDGVDLRTCINNPGASMIQFTLQSGTSEGFAWQSLDVTGNSSGGQSGLDAHVETPWIWADVNADPVFNSGDLPMMDRGFFPGPNDAFPFVAGASTLNLAAALSDILPLYMPNERDQINLPRDRMGTFLLAFDLSSPVQVPHDGSIFFDAHMNAGAIHLVGQDSGDPVLILDDRAFDGHVSVFRGEVFMDNGSQPKLDVDPSCPNPPMNCSDEVIAMTVVVNTSGVEPVRMDTFTVAIEVDSPLPLNQLIASARVTHSESFKFEPIGPMNIDFNNGFMTLSPQAATAGNNFFYSFLEMPRVVFHIWVEVLPSATGTLRLRFDQAGDTSFAGRCSLVAAGQIPVEFSSGLPMNGTLLNFTGGTRLEFGLENAQQDFPDVRWSGNLPPFSAVRMTARAELEDQRITALRFVGVGSGIDSRAVKGNDFTTGGAPGGADNEWTQSGPAFQSIAVVTDEGLAQDGRRFLATEAAWSAAATFSSLSYNLEGESVSLSAATTLSYFVASDQVGTPLVFPVFREVDGDVWQAAVGDAPGADYAEFTHSLTAGTWTLIAPLGDGVFSTAAITHIGFNLGANGSNGVTTAFRFDTIAAIGPGLLIRLTDLEPGVELLFNGTTAGFGGFDPAGNLVFDPVDLVATGGQVPLTLLFSPSAATIAGLNDGDFLNVTLPPGGVDVLGVTSGLPPSRIDVHDELDQGIIEPLPFRAPLVVIGPGRIFVRQNSEVFPLGHVRDATNVVALSFGLTPDRTEDVLLEEVVVTAAGTMNELTAIDGAAVRLHLNEGGFSTFEPQTDDVQIGVGMFTADNGTAVIRFPGLALTSQFPREFLLAIDLTGAGANFETFQYSVVGVAGIRARGALSGDFATPWYGGNDTSMPDAGLLPGEEHVIGKATVDIANSGLIPGSDPKNPTITLPGTLNAPVLSLVVTPRIIEDMSATSLIVHNRGTLDQTTAVTAARLVRDLNGNGVAEMDEPILGSATFTAQNQDLPIVFNPSLNLLAGAPQTWLLTFDIAGSATIGGGLQVFLTLPPPFGTPDETILNGLGLFSGDPIGVLGVSEDAELAGPFLQFSSGIVDVTPGPFNPAAGAYPFVSMTAPMMQFRTRETFNLENVSFETITFSVTSPNAADLNAALGATTFVLYREDPACANGVFDCFDEFMGSSIFVDGGTPTSGTIGFTLPGGTVVSQGQTHTWLLQAQNINAPETSIGAIFGVSLPSAAAITGTGQTTGLPGAYRLPPGGLLGGPFVLFRIQGTMMVLK